MKMKIRFGDDLPQTLGEDFREALQDLLDDESITEIQSKEILEFFNESTTEVIGSQPKSKE